MLINLKGSGKLNGPWAPHDACTEHLWMIKEDSSGPRYLHLSSHALFGNGKLWLCAYSMVSFVNATPSEMAGHLYVCC